MSERLLLAISNGGGGNFSGWAAGGTDSNALKRKNIERPLRGLTVMRIAYCTFHKEKEGINDKNQAISSSWSWTQRLLCIFLNQSVLHCDLEEHQSDTFGSERRKSATRTLSGGQCLALEWLSQSGFSKHNFTGWRDDQSCSLKLSVVLMWWLMAADLQRVSVEPHWTTARRGDARQQMFISSVMMCDIPELQS